MRHPQFSPWQLMLIAAGTALAALSFSACSSGSASEGTGMGTVHVHMTDAPLDISEVQSVTVTITGVILYPGDDPTLPPEAVPPGPVSLLTHPETFDLLTLTDGATTLLASGEAPAARYQRIRLEVSEAELTWKDGTTEPLKIESGKVDIPLPFNLSVGEDASITLDFDAAASVQVNETANDKLILRPVVTPAH
jgi:hypothetical protein